VRVNLKGIHKVKVTLSSGEPKTYYYAYRGGPQIKAEPGTPDFIQQYQEAHSNLRQPRGGTFHHAVAAEELHLFETMHGFLLFAHLAHDFAHHERVHELGARKTQRWSFGERVDDLETGEFFREHAPTGDDGALEFQARELREPFPISRTELQTLELMQRGRREKRSER